MTKRTFYLGKGMESRVRSLLSGHEVFVPMLIPHDTVPTRVTHRVAADQYWSLCDQNNAVYVLEMNLYVYPEGFKEAHLSFMDPDEARMLAKSQGIEVLENAQT